MKLFGNAYKALIFQIISECVLKKFYVKNVKHNVFDGQISNSLFLGQKYERPRINRISFLCLLQYQLMITKKIQIFIFFLIVLHSQTPNLSQQGFAAHSDEDQQKYDIIVIGAGFAGTSAASQLAKDGDKVLLLEASDYIGGRAHHKNIPLLGGQSINFELGANWIHGANPNHPIYQLAKEVGNVQFKQTLYSTDLVYDELRNDVSQSVGIKLDRYFEIIGELAQFKGQNMSIYDGLMRLYPQILSDKEYMYNAGASQFDQSAPITQINADQQQGYRYIQGEEMFVISGYQKMPQYLANHSNIKVLLNHKAISVTRANDKSTVTCENGFVATAKSIVIAVPLGVLKKKTIKFTPELPVWKTTAIEKIGFGNVCKILVVPKIPFNITRTEDILGVVLDDINQRGSAAFWLNLFDMVKLPALMTFGLAPNADRLETMPMADLKTLIAKRLTLFLNRTIQTTDFDVERSSWKSNPNIGGAYSFPGVYTTLGHWEDMAKPIQDRNWFFAGEHTYDKYRGTTHGAYLSGQVAAKKISKLKSRPNA